MELETRPFGSTGTDVTILGFGAMELRSAPPARVIEDEDADALLHAVLDGGINFVDTSPDYGRSEELIGMFLSSRRDEYFLASKCACPVVTDPTAGPPFRHDFSRANVRAGVEQSLRRMKTDHLDLVQVHSSPTRAELEREGTVAELVALREEGKVRFLGISGMLPELPDHLAMGVFDAFQIPYSALQREHEALITRAAALGAGTVIRGGVARGALAPGREGADPGTEARRQIWERAASVWERAASKELLDGMSPMEFLLRFTLSHPDLHTTIIGTSRIEHLRANLAAAEKGPLSAEVYESAKARLAGAGSIPT